MKCIFCFWFFFFGREGFEGASEEKEGDWRGKSEREEKYSETRKEVGEDQERAQ